MTMPTYRCCRDVRLSDAMIQGLYRRKYLVVNGGDLKSLMDNRQSFASWMQNAAMLQIERADSGLKQKSCLTLQVNGTCCVLR